MVTSYVVGSSEGSKYLLCGSQAMGYSITPKTAILVTLPILEEFNFASATCSIMQWLYRFQKSRGEEAYLQKKKKGNLLKTMGCKMRINLGL